MSYAMDYEAVIGLEVHVQLNTESKMFTRVPSRYGAPPNSLTNPVVMGMPGTLPVMNRGAVEKTIRTGLMFRSRIAEICKWDRKNYFYPDQPKNYQISQYDQPLCQGGEVEIECAGPSRNVMGEHRMVRLNRIHLEEDTAKLSHSGKDTLIDFNRAGRPLLEIVTDPDLRSPEEVFAFLTSLKMHMIFAGISDCDMEKGELRCDANISLREKGDETLGPKVEIKNLNSISGVRDGVTFEIRRQREVLRKGHTVLQETRHWNAEEGFTYSSRQKEEAHDYRYFPDPDLMPVKISRAWRDRLESDLPELPFAKQRRYFKEFHLPYALTSVICHDPELSALFERAVDLYPKPRAIANFVANELLRELSASRAEGPISLSQCKVRPEHIAELAELVEDGTLSKQIAQNIFPEVFANGESPARIVERKGLRQSSDEDEIEAVCIAVIEENPKPAQQFRAGRENAINALKGKVMQATRGKANPRLVDATLRKLLRDL